MDADSVGDRLKEIQICNGESVESAEEPEEEVPKILSPEINDVFHVFVNMLDLKSYMNLCETSQKMQKRCMENKMIRINVDVDEVIVQRWRFTVKSPSTFLSLGLLKSLPCKVNARKLEICDSPEATVANSLKELQVNKVHRLRLQNYSMGQEMAIAIIKDFGVKELHLDRRVDAHFLRSILQLNLDELDYPESVPIDLLLEVNSPIREIHFRRVEEISKDQLTHISWKIQAGLLHRLKVPVRAIKRSNFDEVPIERDEPLPDERPLLLSGRHFDEFWFLHRHNEVTMITRVAGEGYWEIYKCEQWELPYIMREEEDIMKDLSEKRSRISCSREQFCKFSETLLPMSHAEDKGTLPDARPLYFYQDKSEFLMLDEEDNLRKCSWSASVAEWESVPSSVQIDHPRFAKYMFQKFLKQARISETFRYYCRCLDEFESWFEDFETLPFDYWSDLPTDRPLIFKKPFSTFEFKHIRVLLLGEELFQCTFYGSSVTVEPCDPLNRPPIFFTAENIAEILKSPRQNRRFACEYETFHDGMEKFKNASHVLHSSRVHKSSVGRVTMEEYWYLLSATVWKVRWAQRRLSFHKDDLRGSPPDFMKEVFRYFVEHSLNNQYSFKLGRQGFCSCLEQFTAVPFDYSGTLPSASPLFFVREDTRFYCRDGAKNRRLEWWSMDAFVFWSKMKKCSWYRKKVEIKPWHSERYPSALTSKEYLETQIHAPYDEDTRYQWYGNNYEFLACLREYKKLPFDHEGPLPEERPLLFQHQYDDNKYFILRKDSSVIECTETRDLHISLSLCTYTYRLPNALKSILN